jgi:hypothetical protein
MKTTISSSPLDLLTEVVEKCSINIEDFKLPYKLEQQTNRVILRTRT